jgi:nucleotidyltransferase substrate binding protein (TIGR01987 family)
LAEFSFQAVQFDRMDTSKVGALHQTFWQNAGQLFDGLCLNGNIQVTAPRARSIFPRITGALKDLVAKPDRRDEKLVLTNSNLMGRERFSERQAAVLNAAARLAEAATLPETDIVRDAAIQRFEFTFELVWKTLQLYLEHEGLESSGPRAVLKRAFVMRLIPDQDEADVWLRMLDDRNLTSHAYDETLAVCIYTRIVHDYAPRLAQMAKKIQTLRWD